jgi:hypothetical protein
VRKISSFIGDPQKSQGLLQKHFDGTRRSSGGFAVEPMLGTGGATKESENSNEYFRYSITNSWLFIWLAGGGVTAEDLSALGISEECWYYDIILKTAKRQWAVALWPSKAAHLSPSPASRLLQVLRDPL